MCSIIDNNQLFRELETRMDSLRMDATTGQDRSAQLGCFGLGSVIAFI